MRMTGRHTSVLIVREPNNVRVDLLQQRSGLVTIKRLESLLQHPTTVGMGGEFVDVSNEGLMDEIGARVQSE